MEITINKETDRATAVVEGRVDTTNSSEFMQDLSEVVESCSVVVLDCAKLEYISSAGLRVLLSVHKAMARKDGFFFVENVSRDILEIFEITGFSRILTINSGNEK
ncbi:STAS domain-containing protein [Ruminococcus sp.]|uniref:STAS domain-containing protein n=1 Tax=Ruminococcus sp. TaxID=41978 RepID=UPI0025FE4BF2|nr:STAS domain-containing protein [Ruminococcus sp.]MBQ8967444.1 STAS domain-containing protein [Ruminococcus sp.]